MWLFSKHGFVDLVQHPQDSDQLLIRCQLEEDMKAIVRLLDEEGGTAHAIEPIMDGDYRFVVQADRKIVAAVIAQMVTEIDYDRFKQAVHFNLGQDSTYVVMLGPHDLQVAKLLKEQ